MTLALVPTAYVLTLTDAEGVTHRLARPETHLLGVAESEDLVGIVIDADTGRGWLSMGSGSQLRALTPEEVKALPILDHRWPGSPVSGAMPGSGVPKVTSAPGDSTEAVEAEERPSSRRGMTVRDAAEAGRLVAAVAEVYRLSVREIQDSKYRAPRHEMVVIREARAMVASIARESWAWSYGVIARIFGCTDATAIYLIQKTPKSEAWKPNMETVLKALSA